MMPAPEDISAILLKPMRGPMMGWKVEEGESYTEVEWTYFAQNGEETEEPAPDEPEPDDPEDPPSDGEEEGCTAGSCTGIVDPWTCECHEDIRDPWETEVRDGVVMIGI